MFHIRFNDGSWLGGRCTHPRRVDPKSRAEAGRFATAQDALYYIEAINTEHPDLFRGYYWAVTNERGEPADQAPSSRGFCGPYRQ
jgi:hypothetical protein